MDRDLRPYAGIARSRLDLQQTLLDFGDFEAKELHDEFGGGARHEKLGATALAIDLANPAANPITYPEIFFGNHLIAGQAGFDLAGLDHRAFTVESLDRAGQQGIATPEEVVDDLLALGIADLLQDHLFGSLSTDPTGFDRLEFFLEVLADIDVGNLLARLGQDDLDVVILELTVGYNQPATKGFRLAGLAIDGDPYIDLFLETLLGSGRQSAFERGEHNLFQHAFFARQRIDQQQYFAAHREAPKT